MKSLLIAALSVVFCATAIFGMGKKDASTQESEKALQSVKPAAKPASKPVEASVQQPVSKPVGGPAARPAAPAVGSAAQDGNKVVATINGKALKNSVVEERLNDAMKMQLGAMGAGVANLPPETIQSLRDRMRKDVIDGLVLEQLVDEKLKTEKVEVGEKDVDGRINEIMAQNSITLETIQEELSKNGVTMEAFRGQLKRNLGIEKLLDAQMTAAGESTSPTDEEVKQFYDENVDRFGNPEQVRASHILIKTENMDEAGKAEAKKKAEEILAKARAGEDFAHLAMEHSEDLGSKAKGGEYVFARGRMVKPFEDTAFSLEVGQISDLVETQYGYHIIKLSEKIPAKTESFDDVKDRIKLELTNQKKGRFWMTLREQLKNEAKIEWSAEEKARMDKAADRAVIRPQPQPQPK